MHKEQLSFFESNSFDRVRHSNLQSEPVPDHVDSPIFINQPDLEITAQQYFTRRRTLERDLAKICSSDLPGKFHLEQYLCHKYRRNCSSNTLKVTATSLIQFLSFHRNASKRCLEQMSREDLEGFVEHVQDRGLKPNTVCTRIRVVYGFVRFLIENKVVGYELLERRIKLRMPDRLPRAIEPEDLNQLLAVINDIRNRCLILLLLRTGMRIGELLNIKVTDLELEEQKILIYQAQKTGVGRVVYYSDDAQAALLAWLKIRDPFKRNLFYGRGHQSLCYESARTIFKKYLQLAGLEHSGYTLHCLRHTFATELLNARMPLECLQVLLGHANLEITRHYARLSDKTREQEYFKAMNRILKGEADADD